MFLDSCLINLCNRILYCLKVEINSCYVNPIQPGAGKGGGRAKAETKNIAISKSRFAILIIPLYLVFIIAVYFFFSKHNLNLLQFNSN